MADSGTNITKLSQLGKLLSYGGEGYISMLCYLIGNKKKSISTSNFYALRFIILDDF